MCVKAAMLSTLAVVFKAIRRAVRGSERRDMPEWIHFEISDDDVVRAKGYIRK